MPKSSVPIDKKLRPHWQKAYIWYNISSLSRNGEIDIIAKDKPKNELVFIEVKTRSNFKYGNPIESVNKNKQRHLKLAIKYYIYKNRIKNVAIRIDIIEVYIQEGECKINHIKQVLWKKELVIFY